MPHAGMTIASYFAYQALAGALLHLIALGVGMGALLGALGGLAACHPSARRY